jgi:putative transposase
LGIYLSEERNMLIVEKILNLLYRHIGEHTVYTDRVTWSDEACNLIGIKHHLYSPFQKSLMERVNQYLKDRIENFDDYYPCIKEECNFLMYITVYNYLYLNITNKRNYFELEKEVNIILN